MALNSYFQNYDYLPEQNLLSDLVAESIQIYGVNIVYLPRTTPNIDRLFLEDPTSKFVQSASIEMYIKNYEGWGGNADIMSKFGISMGDQLVLHVSRARFAEAIGTPFSISRPREGDLIFFSIPNAMFEIKFVEHEATFYQTGSLQYYEIRCERFNYSSEEITTGVTSIDSVEDNYSFNVDGNYLLNEDGSTLIAEDDSIIALEEAYEAPDDIDGTARNKYFETAGNSIEFNIEKPFKK